MTEIKLEDGKYTYRETDGRQEVLRYGEPWRDVTGDKFIGSMAAEIESLRFKLNILQSPTTDECDHPHEFTSYNWEHITCNLCGWVLPGGVREHRPNSGWFPSLAAHKEWLKYKTYPGMSEIKPRKTR